MRVYLFRLKTLVLIISGLRVCSASGAGAPAPIICTDSGRAAVELTVYNNNLGLVKDVRAVKLPQGSGELRFMDVASEIMPVTVRAVSITHPGDFTVLEQNYEYDLMNAQKLLDKYVGKKIKIVDVTEYKDKKQELEAILLSNNDGQIYKINDQIYLGYPGHTVLPSLPGDLIARPTLAWLFECKRPAEHRIEISYLTAGINWTADYIMVLNKDDTRSDLNGWVSIDNRSGATYTEAKITLVAGKIHTAESQLRKQGLRRAADVMAMAAEPQFEEKEFFEYHIYNLQRPATVKNNQTKQIHLLQAADIAVEKELLTGSFNTGYGPRQYEATRKQPVDVFVRMKNNNLGIPLPAGVVRVYKNDEIGSRQLIGEDRIEHTPKDEEIKLKIGEAFDIIAERTQKSYNEIGSRAYEAAWEISLRNHKKERVKIGVVEKVGGDWKIVSKSHPYTAVDAFTIRFDVSVPAGEEVKVTYKVRTQM